MHNERGAADGSAPEPPNTTCKTTKLSGRERSGFEALAEPIHCKASHYPALELMAETTLCWRGIFFSVVVGVGYLQTWGGPGRRAAWRALDGQVGVLALRSHLCAVRVASAPSIVQRRGGVPAFWKALCFQLERKKGEKKRTKKMKFSKVKCSASPAGEAGRWST